METKAYKTIIRVIVLLICINSICFNAFTIPVVGNPPKSAESSGTGEPRSNGTVVSDGTEDKQSENEKSKETRNIIAGAAFAVLVIVAMIIYMFFKLRKAEEKLRKAEGQLTEQTEEILGLKNALLEIGKSCSKNSYDLRNFKRSHNNLVDNIKTHGSSIANIKNTAHTKDSGDSSLNVNPSDEPRVEPIAEPMAVTPPQKILTKTELYNFFINSGDKSLSLPPEFEIRQLSLGASRITDTQDGGTECYVCRTNNRDIVEIYPSSIIKSKFAKEFFASIYDFLISHDDNIVLEKPCLAERDSYGVYHIIKRGTIRIRG